MNGQRRRTATGIIAAMLVANATAGAEPANDLIGTTWRADDIDGRGVIDFLQTTITFSEDGRIAGRGGCNRYFGVWSRDGAQISMGPFGSTRMACPPAVLDQESRFLGALAVVDRMEARNGLLYLYAGEALRLRLSQIDDPEPTANQEP